MQLTREQNILVQEFLQGVIYHPLPFSVQPYIHAGARGWCYEWKLIEILKCFIDGPSTYMRFNPANRLKNHPIFTKESMIAEMQLRDELYNQLIVVKDQYKSISYYMPGRGLDIMFGDFIKEWDKCYVYEPRAEFANSIKFYFKNKKNFEFIDQPGWVDPSVVIFSGEEKIQEDRQVISRQGRFFSDHLQITGEV